MNNFRNQIGVDSKKSLETLLQWLNVVNKVQRGFMEVDRVNSALFTIHPLNKCYLKF